MQKGKQRTWVLRMRAVDRSIFMAVKNGTKSLETRALNDPKRARSYSGITKGDSVVFVCGKKRVRMRVGRVARYRSVAGLLRTEPYRRIAPWTTSRKEAAAMYDTFPGYRERIKKFGIICFEVKKI